MRRRLSNDDRVKITQLLSIYRERSAHRGLTINLLFSVLQEGNLLCNVLIGRLVSYGFGSTAPFPPDVMNSLSASASSFSRDDAGNSDPHCGLSH